MEDPGNTYRIREVTGRYAPDERSAERTPAQLFALIAGSVLLVAGVMGFFYTAAFGSPGRTGEALGIFEVNGWHNVAHVVTGALGLVALGYVSSRRYALAIGSLYVALAVWGFVLADGKPILDLVPVNTADDFLHAIVGGLGIGAYLASAPRPAPEPPPARARSL